MTDSDGMKAETAKPKKPGKPVQTSSGSSEIIAPPLEARADATNEFAPALPIETTAAEATSEPQSNLARTKISHVPKTIEGSKMNATEAMKSFGVGYEYDALSTFKTVAEKATHNLEAVTQAATAAMHGAEQARAYLAASSKTALDNQYAAASAFAKVKNAQEALDLQAQFARKALDAYSTNVRAMSELFSSTLSATLKPLSVTFSASS